MLNKMLGSLVIPILFAVVVGVSPVLADEHGSLCSNKGDMYHNSPCSAENRESVPISTPEPATMIF